MHPEALAAGTEFARRYLWGRSSLRVLDVGSMDMNGSLRAALEGPDWLYVGLDMAPGENVHVIARHRFPFRDQTFDAIVSTSAFEHDMAFWLTFVEMARTVKKGGLVYVHAPMAGPYHKMPVDCWRFYPDAWRALAGYVDFGLELIETAVRESPPWTDHVGIWRKR